VTAGQAGGNRHALAHAVAIGRLEPVRRGVYRVAGAPTTWHQQILAAVLATPASRASHRSAARLFGFPGFDDDVLEITVRGRQRSRPNGVIVHDTQVVGAQHGGVVDRIPTMSAARTLCDLTAVVRPWIVQRAVDDALRRKLTTVDQLRGVLDALDGRGRRRSTVMRETLRWREQGLQPGDSAPEARLAQLLVRGGLPRPEQQHRVRAGGRTYRLDLAYPHARLAIEYDGWEFHSTREAFDRDRARANALELAGWRILRFTSRSTDEVIVGTIRAALTRPSVT
jgi:very-short-patch-repair endonuclease